MKCNDVTAAITSLQAALQRDPADGFALLLFNFLIISCIPVHFIDRISERGNAVASVCLSIRLTVQGRIIHEAGEAEASGPGPRYGAPTARYNENVQSRTTLGPEISKQKICGILNFCQAESRSFCHRLFMPVTNGSGERSFSVLSRVKNSYDYV